MPLYHDAGEKLQKERRAVRSPAAKYDMAELYDLWDEMEEGKTPAAIIVKDFDIIGMLAQAFEYIVENPGIPALTEFMRENGPDVKTDNWKTSRSGNKSGRRSFYRYAPPAVVNQNS